jgi:amino acid transporter
MAEHHTTGDLGRFEGFLAALWSASFTVVGPEYISMVSAEAKRPRIYIKTAFKTIYWRFGIFFILGSLCVGIVIPYNDPTLVDIIFGSGSGGGTAAASPYVIAMSNLGVEVLPHITNALMVTSIFSAGNTYTYCATRSLYGLAIEGRAPRFLRKCTKNGVPIFCFCVVMAFPFLSFLQLSNSSSKVLTWLINLVTAGGIIDFIVMCVTYIFFYRACKAQGIDRRSFPYTGWFQPYCAYIGLTGMTLVVIFYGYSSFTPWSVETFFSYYTMVIVAPILYVGWKLLKRTKIVRPHEADLVWERHIVDAYEESFFSPPVGFWTEMIQLVGFKRSKQDRRASVDGSLTQQF